MAEKILFLTGKLAEASLLKTLEKIKSADFTYDVIQIGVSVAGLITTDMVKRRLKIDTSEYDQIMLPGLCAGNVADLANHLGTPVVRGPIDLRDLPEHFGSPARKVSLENYSVSIFAEIVDAPHLSIDEIVSRAEYYSKSGANVIDIGCLPNQEFPHLQESIQELNNLGFVTSIDSLNENELLAGGKAGADYLLSLSKRSLWIADEVDSIPVLIPVGDEGIETLYEAIDKMAGKGREFLADSILNPIHFGFTESICRFCELRKHYSDVPIMMGIGNLTELTDADTMGMNAMLMGIASELDVSAILTTEVSGHATSAIAEADRARRILYAAKEDLNLPVGYDDGLLALHEKKPFPASADEIRDLARMIRDPSYRIQISDKAIHVFNRSGIFEATDPFDIYPHLGVEQDGSHAFYLGVELARAQIARQLHKRYTQDRLLSWGIIVPPENPGEQYKEPGTTKQSKNDKQN